MFVLVVPKVPGLFSSCPCGFGAYVFCALTIIVYYYLAPLLIAVISCSVVQDELRTLGPIVANLILALALSPNLNTNLNHNEF